MWHCRRRVQGERLSFQWWMDGALNGQVLYKLNSFNTWMTHHYSNDFCSSFKARHAYTRVRDTCLQYKINYNFKSSNIILTLIPKKSSRNVVQVLWSSVFLSLDLYLQVRCFVRGIPKLKRLLCSRAPEHSTRTILFFSTTLYLILILRLWLVIQCQEEEKATDTDSE